MSSNYSQFPPSSPLLNSINDDYYGGNGDDYEINKENNFKSKINNNKKPSILNNHQLFDYPTPNPSSSIGYLPSSSSIGELLTSPIKKRQEQEEEQEEEIIGVSSPFKESNKSIDIYQDKEEEEELQQPVVKKVKFITPYQTIKHLNIPINFTNFKTIGRSSKLSSFKLTSHNKSISRVHLKLKFDFETKLLELKCIGWNGVNVTIPYLIDVKSMNDNNKNEYLITPRNNDVNDVNVNVNDNDDSNRIISRDSKLTNFYILRNESFKMPILKGVVLDIRGELILLEFNEDLDITDDESFDTSKMEVVEEEEEVVVDDVLKAVKQSTVKTLEPVKKSTIEIIKPVEQSTIETVEPVKKSTIETVEPVKQSTIETIEPVKKSIIESIKPVKKSTIETIKPVEQSTIKTLEPVKKSTIETIQPVKKSSTESVKPVEKAANESVEPVEQSVELAKQSIKKPIKESVESIKKVKELTPTPLQSPMNSNINTPNNLKRSFSSLITPIKKELTNGNYSITPIPLKEINLPSPSTPKELLKPKQRGRPLKSPINNNENNDNNLSLLLSPLEFNNNNNKKSKIIKKPTDFTDFEIETILKPLNEELIQLMKNLLINHLAYSRTLQTPLKQIMELKKINELNINKLQLRCILIHKIECIGVIFRSGKDASGKPLDEEYYYIPEKDNDLQRVKLIEDLKGSASHLRNCRKVHKQYFWKKPK